MRFLGDGGESRRASRALRQPRRCAEWDLFFAATSRGNGSTPRPRNPPRAGAAPRPGSLLRARALGEGKGGRGVPPTRPRPPPVASLRLRGRGRRCPSLLRRRLRPLHRARAARGCAGARPGGARRCAAASMCVSVCMRAPRADHWRGFPEGGKCHLIHTELFKSPHPRADTHTH